jgi:hypothetical protein
VIRTHVHLKVLGAFLAIGLTSGCYVYKEVDPGSLAPGQSVRAHLTPEPARLGVTGVELNRSVAVSGRVVDPWEDRLVIVQDRGDPMARHAFVSVSDTIRAEWGVISFLERKEFSSVRTGALVLGTAVLGGLAMKALFGDWAGGRNIGREEGPETFQPLFP